MYNAMAPNLPPSRLRWDYSVEPRKYIKTALFGAAICFALLLTLGIFDSPDAGRAFRILCDAFFTTSILLMGFGFLTAIRSTGFFNMLGFMKDYMKAMYLPGRRERQYRDFYDYKVANQGKTRAQWHIVTVGACFFVVSMVFLVLEAGI